MPIITGAKSESVVYNQDVLGLINRINRFIEESTKSVSSGLSYSNEFDLNRLKSYLNAIDSYHNWIRSQPQLDMPETAPKGYQLEPNPEVPDLENEDINDLVRLFLVARDELVNSQSARMGCSMVVQDSARLTAIIQKARAFLTDYVEQVQPLDLPESSPANPLSGSGRQGV